MDKYSYRFTVVSLNISVMMLTGAGIILIFQKELPTPLLPFLAPILTGLGGLLVSPPKQSIAQNDHIRS